MNEGTLLLIGAGALLFYYFGTGAAVLSNLKFLENGMSFDVSNPLRIVVNLSVIVQNPTSGSLTLNSIAGYFYINGSQSGNVSYFTPTTILPNSQTQIVLTLSVNDTSIIADILSYVNSGSSAITVEVKATANANNVPAPIDLIFQPLS